MAPKPGPVKTEQAATAIMLRRQVGNITVAITEQIGPPAKRTTSARAPDPGREQWTPEAAEAAAEAGRARRLLKSLSAICATREPATFRAEQRLDLLCLAGRLLAFIDQRDGRAVQGDALRRWASKHTPEAPAAAVSAALLNTTDDPLVAVPAPFEIGHDLALTAQHWFLAGRPWGIWQTDLTAQEVRAVQRDAKRARDRARAQARRAKAGSVPHAKSLAAQARALGITAPALRKRRDKAARGIENVAHKYFSTYRGDEIDTERRAAEAAPRTSRPVLLIPVEPHRRLAMERMLAAAADAFSPAASSRPGHRGGTPRPRRGYAADQRDDDASPPASSAPSPACAGGTR